MEFSEISKVLDNIHNSATVPKKNDIMRDFFKTARDKFKPEDIKPGLYSILRLILPKLDRERPSLAIKESTFSRIITKMLCLPPGGDRTLLSNAGSGSFPEIAYSVLRKHLSLFKSSLTTEDVNGYLDQLSRKTKDAEREEILLQMFRKSSPQEVKWIIRIILKNLRLGLGEKHILRAFHQDGYDLFSQSSSLLRVAEVLHDSSVNLQELGVTIFEAFAPMLSKRVDGTSFQKDFKDNYTYYVETKYDGERFQIHMKNGVLKYFSRRGFDFTDTYGGTYNDGLLSPKLKSCFTRGSALEKIILDGEMMLYNKRTKRFGSKGMNLDVKHLSSKGVYQPCFVVYDILLVDDEILVNQPLSIRIKRMRQEITPLEGIVVLSEYTKVNSRQSIVDSINQATRTEEEGIIVKYPQSTYKFGDRNSGWFKLKMEYFDEAVTDLDLLLIGASSHHGTNTSTSNKKTFFVGVRSGTTPTNKPLFISFAKVTSGFNDLEFDSLTERFNRFGVKYSGNIEQLQFGSDTPEYCINPSDSLVFVVRATELIRNNNDSLKTPYTLRFARVIRIRDDKPVEDCLSLEQLCDLTRQNKSVIKLNKGKLELEDVLKEKVKRVKKVPDIKPVVDLRINEYNFFDGYKFYVHSSSGSVASLNRIEYLVRLMGGSVAITMSSEVDVVLINGEFDDKIKGILKKVNADVDVIKIDWLFRVSERLEAGVSCKYKIGEIVYLGDKENSFSESFDRFGDPFCDKINVTELKQIVNSTILKESLIDM